MIGEKKSYLVRVLLFYDSEICFEILNPFEQTRCFFCEFKLILSRFCPISESHKLYLKVTRN